MGSFQLQFNNLQAPIRSVHVLLINYDDDVYSPLFFLSARLCRFFQNIIGIGIRKKSTTMPTASQPLAALNSISVPPAS